MWVTADRSPVSITHPYLIPRNNQTAAAAPRHISGIIVSGDGVGKFFGAGVVSESQLANSKLIKIVDCLLRIIFFEFCIEKVNTKNQEII